MQDDDEGRGVWGRGGGCVEGAATGARMHNAVLVAFLCHAALAQMFTMRAGGGKGVLFHSVRLYFLHVCDSRICAAASSACWHVAIIMARTTSSGGSN